MANIARKLLFREDDLEFLKYVEKRLKQFGMGGGGVVTPPAGENLFIQETQPADAGPLLWIELNPDTTVKTFWVKTP